MAQMDDSFSLMWSELSYALPETDVTCVNLFSKKKRPAKQIIKPMDGFFTSGSINGVLGPSGSGKTTLLNCLTGRAKKNVSGDCFVRSHIRNLNVRVGYVPQVDSLFEAFTVRETITFACRLNNCPYEWYESEMQMKLIIDCLGLNDVIDSPINKVSGGERKRTSIAIELVSQPSILALDEPTSGLDADNCDKLMAMLKKLSKTFSSPVCTFRPLIVLSIHSPSYDIFTQFDAIYLLSRDGHNLYFGPPKSVNSHFQQFGFIAVKGNPAHHIIDIANGKYGCDKFNLIASHRHHDTVLKCNEFDRQVSNIRKTCQTSCPQQIKHLVDRSLTYYFIKVPQALVRISEHFFVFFLLTFSMIQTIAGNPMCWTSSDDLFNISLTTDEYFHRFTYELSFIDQVADFIPIGSYSAVILIDATFISSIAAVLLMIYHWPVCSREISNSWYTLTSYFIAKVSADFLIRTFCIAPAALLFFFRSSAPVDIERIAYFIAILIIDSSIWENLAASITLLTGCKENKLLDTIVSVFVYLMMDFVFIDIVVPMHNLSRMFYFFKIFSPQANIYSMVIVLLFGLNRCKPISGQVSSVDLSMGKPVDVLKTVWRDSNITSSIPTRAAATLGLDRTFLQQVFRNVDNWLTPYNHSDRVDNSFILTSMGREDSFYQQLIVACSWFLVSYFVFWCTLRNFYRKSHS